MALIDARQVQGASTTQVNNAINAVFSDVLPTPENRTGGAGTMPLASRGDHAHARLTATATGTLGAAGEATITFTRTFSVKPACTCLLVEAADTQPVLFRIKSWVITGGLYTGCILKGQRMTVLPAQAQLSATALLTATVAGVNVLAASLNSFNLVNGNAVGAEYSFIAIQPS